MVRYVDRGAACGTPQCFGACAPHSPIPREVHGRCPKWQRNGSFMTSCDLCGPNNGEVRRSVRHRWPKKDCLTIPLVLQEGQSSSVTECGIASPIRSSHGEGSLIVILCQSERRTIKKLARIPAGPFSAAGDICVFSSKLLVVLLAHGDFACRQADLVERCL